jgi:hypothetical protein
VTVLGGRRRQKDGEREDGRDGRARVMGGRGGDPRPPG